METKTRRIGKVLAVVGSYICVGCLGGYLERFFRMKAREEDYKRRVEELGAREVEERLIRKEVEKQKLEYELRLSNVRDFAKSTFGGAYSQYVEDWLARNTQHFNKTEEEN